MPQEIPDFIDQLAGLAPDSPVAALRREKPDLVVFAQGSNQSLLEPAEPGDLSLLERHAVAYRVGLLTGFPAVEKRHRRRLLDFGPTDLASHVERYPDAKLEPRLTAILRHTDLVTLRPGAAGPEDIAALHAAGLTPAAVVTLGQLLGYLGYQIRAIAVARAFAEGPGLSSAPAKDRPQPDPSTTQRTPRQRLRFSSTRFDWQPWTATIAEGEATREQWQVLDDVVPHMKRNPYYLLLAQDPEPLRQRTGLFNGIMKGEGGSAKSDRELAAVAASRVNGCVYCAAVHAAAYNQLTGDTDQMQRILDDGVDTALREREHAIVDVAVKLTEDPASFAAVDLQPLRDLGFSDLEILDITNGAAIFAWANRLLQTLGESKLAAPAPA
ncbi:MAG: peroxidase-related enzyme [Thermomicrobiales bacterium]|nr:peroxidase-related enzyme [Thermomicrobiales bacterium]